MTEHLHAVPSQRFDSADGIAETWVALRAGRRTFGTLLVHEHPDHGDWSVAVVPTTLSPATLRLSDVADFARSQLPETRDLSDDEALAQTRSEAVLPVGGRHRTYRLSTPKGREAFQAALQSMTGDDEWFARIDVNTGRGSKRRGGVLWLEKGGALSRDGTPMLGVGRHGAPWTEACFGWMSGHHAAGTSVDPTEGSEVIEQTFATITSARGIDAEQAARAFHLRRFPAAVRARGAALVTGIGIDDGVEELRHRRREVLGYARPGNTAGTPPDHAVLFVPLTARAGAYPRSINRTPVSLVRTPAPVLQ